MFRRSRTETVKVERAARPLDLAGRPLARAVVVRAPLLVRVARLQAPAGRPLARAVVVRAPPLVRVARPLARAVRPPVPAGPRLVRLLVRAVLGRVLACVPAFVRLACVVRA